MQNFQSEQDLMTFTKSIIGKKFREVDRLGLLETTKRLDKGVLGKIVETGFYGYSLNNNGKADFDSLGIELKVSGYEVTKNGGITPKERLSLSMINYHELVNETFEFSKFVTKNKKLLILWYEYQRGEQYGDFEIKSPQLYNLSQDETIIQNDFILIQDKIKRGKAHLLSEGDTSS